MHAICLTRYSYLTNAVNLSVACKNSCFSKCIMDTFLHLCDCTFRMNIKTN